MFTIRLLPLWVSAAGFYLFFDVNVKAVKILEIPEKYPNPTQLGYSTLLSLDAYHYLVEIF